MSESRTPEQLEAVMLNIIYLGRSRCGIGFGKYPLGVLDAVKRLLPLVDTPDVREALLDFEERLKR